MNKKIVMMLLKNQEVKQADFIQFILDYLKYKGKPEPTQEQLQGILQLFSMGIFNLSEALKDAVSFFKLQVNTLYDKTGALIKIDVYGN